MRGKPFTSSSNSKSPREGGKMDFEQAFGFGGGSSSPTTTTRTTTTIWKEPGESEVSPNVAILLKPYPAYPFTTSTSSDENRIPSSSFK